MKVTIILKGKIDQQGRQPLQIRINEGDKRRFHPTDIKIEPHYWDKKQQVVLPSHPMCKDLNRKLRAKLLAAEHRPEKKAVAKSITLVHYIIECLSQWETTGEKKGSTIKAQTARLSNIKGFDSSVLLNEVDEKWLRSYKIHLIKKGLLNNTVWDNFKFLRTVYLKALNERIITDDPFRLFDMPRYSERKKNFLLADQVAEIEKLLESGVLTAAETTACVWFLIGCFTGLRYSDMAGFKKSQIRGKLLYLHTVKTDSPVSIELPEKMLALFERVAYLPLRMPNQLFNRMLKRLAMLAGIDINITAHTSRHTFATMALAAGIPIEYVQEILGHQNIKVTQGYAKIISPVRNEHYRKIFK